MTIFMYMYSVMSTTILWKLLYPHRIKKNLMVIVVSSIAATTAYGADEFAQPINCATAEGDLRVLASEKKHAQDEKLKGATGLTPAGALFGIVTGTEDESYGSSESQFDHFSRLIWIITEHFAFFDVAFARGERRLKSVRKIPQQRRAEPFEVLRSHLSTSELVIQRVRYGKREHDKYQMMYVVKDFIFDSVSHVWCHGDEN